jgi:Uma2 family endonuclease
MPTLTLPHRPHERRFTIADVAEMPNDLPSGPVHYELHKGKLITMAPPGDIHGAVESKLAFQLIRQGDERGLGKTRCGETGLVLSRGRLETLYGVDALFIAKSRLPLKRSAEGYLVTIPNIVAEVRSKNDSNKAIMEKVTAYQSAGVDLIWIIDPFKKTITVYQKRRKPKILKEQDTLRADPIIPDFEVSIQKLFAD